MKDKLMKIGIIAIALIGILIYFRYRAYIGYFIAVLAVPYGAYGLFTPYKSAKLYAKKGFAIAYSRQLGSLLLSLGILGYFFSSLYDHLNETIWFAVALLVYITLFFFVLYILNKRYIKKL